MWETNSTMELLGGWQILHIFLDTFTVRENEVLSQKQLPKQKVQESPLIIPAKNTRKEILGFSIAQTAIFDIVIEIHSNWPKPSYKRFQSVEQPYSPSWDGENKVLYTIHKYHFSCWCIWSNPCLDTWICRSIIFNRTPDSFHTKMDFHRNSHLVPLLRYSFLETWKPQTP